MFEIAVTSLPFLSFPSWLQSGLHLRAVKQHAIKIEGLGQYEPFHHGLGQSPSFLMILMNMLSKFACQNDLLTYLSLLKQN